MADNGEKSRQLTTEQRRAIWALTSGADRDTAATLATRSRRTLDRWLTEDELFKAELQAATDEAIQGAGRRLGALADKAIDVLWEVLRKPANQRVALAAANLTLTQLVKMREHAELEERVAKLEEAIR